VLISARPANLRQPREQLVLTVEAAIRIVLPVIRIIEFVRLDVLVFDPEASRDAVRGGFRPRSVTGVSRQLDAEQPHFLWAVSTVSLEDVSAQSQRFPGRRANRFGCVASSAIR
jgi:hypothetical protein